MSIGQTLTAAREKAGMSVEQVAGATRIRRTLVQAIEDDDFAPCGGDFYARGHIRSIATAVGIDAGPLLTDFDSTRGQASARRVAEVFESETAARADRRGPNWSAAMAAALVLVVVYGIAQAVTGGDDPRRPGTTAGSPAPSRSADGRGGRTASPSGTPGAPGPVAQANRGKVTVAIRATDRSWVQASTGKGRVLFEGLLVQGQARTFSDKREIKLIIGNAGGVDLTVNGRSIGAAGRSGQVARVEFTPQDPAAG